jgi:hypothetical protein
MCLSDEARVKQLQGLFEGREAIYIEYGALRAKVSKIKGDPAETKGALFFVNGSAAPF